MIRIRLLRAQLVLACWIGGWMDVWADYAARRIGKLSGSSDQGGCS